MNRLIFGPAQAALEEIKNAARRHQGGRGRIAVAWAREDGVYRLVDAIGDRIPELQFIVGLTPVERQ